MTEEWPKNQASFLARRRTGPRPTTTPTNPHTQLTQNAPIDLQERVFAVASSLAGVEVGPSAVSVPGARAFCLPGCPHGRHDAFMVGREFAHLHPPSDGSLHMVLAPNVVVGVIENGWAERHPLAGRHGLPANIVMVYGPRDENELAVVADLVRASHNFATAWHSQSGRRQTADTTERRSANALRASAPARAERTRWHEAASCGPAAARHDCDSSL